MATPVTAPPIFFHLKLVARISLALGVIAGLVLGKQSGIMLATWLVTRLGLALLPTGLTLRHVYGVSWLAGIGFTMAIFVAGLAFPDADRLSAAKVGIIAASTIAGTVGFVLLRIVSNRRASDPAAADAPGGRSAPPERREIPWTGCSSPMACSKAASLVLERPTSRCGQRAA